MQEIRTFSHLLHPPLLDEFGLKEALRGYITGLSKRSGLKLRLEAAGDFDHEGLPKQLETTLFRIVQAALTNVRLHSGSKTATIVLSRADRPKRVMLEVKDAGQGLSKEVLRALRTGNPDSLAWGSWECVNASDSWVGSSKSRRVDEARLCAWFCRFEDPENPQL